jgi:hypothetical protein
MITISDLSCLQIATKISQICGGQVTQSAIYSQVSYVSNDTSGGYTHKSWNYDDKIPNLKIPDLNGLKISGITLPSFTISNLNAFLSSLFAS